MHPVSPRCGHRRFEGLLALFHDSLLLRLGEVGVALRGSESLHVNFLMS